jgi:short-subunit dehydrogenase
VTPLVPTVVLVTGATGGLGQALALHYAAPGRTLVLHGRDEGKLAALCAACQGRGATPIALQADLRDLDHYRARLESAAATLPIDLALVNAGITYAGRADEASWEDIDAVLQVNLRAALATAAILAPQMRHRGRGQIAFMSSLAAWHGLPHTAAYSATKAGVKAYAEALRGALRPHGVGVSVVMPGYVDTPMTASLPGGRKPFLLSPTEAAKRIAHGLEGNRARIAFPQPLAAGAWLLGALPASWSEALVRKLRL